MTQPKTTSKFTPGPWDALENVVRCEQPGPHKGMIVAETKSYYVGGLDQQAPNARLIAKAPEMYELLEEISGAPRYLQGEATVDFASRLLAWWGNGELHTEARRIKAEIDGVE